MRAFLGMILGVLLTILVVYIHDHIAPDSSVASTQVRTTDGSGRPVTPDTTAQKQWVNWDTVDNDWRGFTTRARHAWNQLSAKLKS